MPTSREAPLVRREPLQGPYFLLTFRHEEVARHARAGQFVMLKAGSAAEPPLRRPISIMSVDPEHGTFTVFLKAVGTVTKALTSLQPGEGCLCLGPLGRGFTPPPEGSEALLVAGGYGIAPFVLFVRELIWRGNGCCVFYGGRGVADLQLEPAFRPMGIPLIATTEDGTRGRKGRVTEAVEDHIAERPGPFALYACGPKGMLHATAGLGRRHGIKTQVSLDPWMGCGIGTCLGCVVRIQEAGETEPRYRCACTEGPIFDADDVVWPGSGCSAAAQAGGES